MLWQSRSRLRSVCSLIWPTISEVRINKVPLSARPHEPATGRRRRGEIEQTMSSLFANTQVLAGVPFAVGHGWFGARDKRMNRPDRNRSCRYEALLDAIQAGAYTANQCIPKSASSKGGSDGTHQAHRAGDRQSRRHRRVLQAA